MWPFSGVRDRIDRWRLTANRAIRMLTALGLVVLLLVVSVRDLYHFPRSVTWPVTQGEVRESRFLRDDTFSIDFRYSYTVDGVYYEGSRITFFQYALFANQYQNQLFIEEHPVGTTVEVRYDPLEPSRSVLMRSIPLSQLWSPVLFALCLVSILVSGIVAFVLRRILDVLRSHAQAYADAISQE